MKRHTFEEGLSARKVLLGANVVYSFIAIRAVLNTLIKNKSICKPYPVYVCQEVTLINLLLRKHA